MKKLMFLTIAWGLAPVATLASDGQASGRIDGRTVDLALDCSAWREGSEATAKAADGSAFEATRLGHNDSLAVIWDTDEKLYQLRFGDVPFAPSVTATASFSNRGTGETFDAEITIDCAG